MKKLIPLILLTIISCKAKQGVSEINNSSDNTKFIDISIEKGENLTFTIKNISSNNIFIFESKKLNIEKYEDDSWRELRILPCPCDAPCHPGNEMEQLLAGESFNLVWNMKESWCGNKKEGMVRETIKEPVGKGRYRIRINFGLENKTKKSFYKEFIID